jgi:hypothetical protein
LGGENRSPFALFRRSEQARQEILETAYNLLREIDIDPGLAELLRQHVRDKKARAKNVSAGCAPQKANGWRFSEILAHAFDLPPGISPLEM